MGEKVVIDGYEIILVRGAPRFRFNKKLVKASDVPEDIKEILIREAQTAQDQREMRHIAALAERAANPGILEGEEAGEPEETEEVEEPITNPMEAPEVTISDRNETFSDLELELIAEVEDLKRQLVESIDVSSRAPIPTLEALAQMLLNEYGIYTAMAGRDPKLGDIHPYSLIPMNRYDQGLAYAERKKALSRLAGGFQPTAAPAEVKTEYYRPEKEVGHRSFADRTRPSFSKGGKSTVTRFRPNDPISEEPTVEPNLRGTTIRPEW